MHEMRSGEREMDWTGLGKNVREEMERQMKMNAWRGITSSNYVRRAVKDGEVDEEEEEKIRQEKREEMEAELALDGEEVFETWVKHEKRRRCKMRVEEGHRRVLEYIADSMRAYLRKKQKEKEQMKETGGEITRKDFRWSNRTEEEDEEDTDAQLLSEEDDFRRMLAMQKAMKRVEEEAHQ